MTDTKLIPARVANDCARRFVRLVTKPPRQWSLADLEYCLPEGWLLRRGVEDGDLFPVTIKNVARVIRGGSERQ